MSVTSFNRKRRELEEKRVKEETVIVEEIKPEVKKEATKNIKK